MRHTRKRLERRWKMSRVFLEEFHIPSREAESGFILSYDPKMTMSCYSDTNVYPFKIFPDKELTDIEFAPITIFYGGNGSGKSTLLNIIAEMLSVERGAFFNNTPFFENYLELCSYKLSYGDKAPRDSRVISSDDVFDFLLDLRAVNNGVDNRREELFDEYMDGKYNSAEFKMRSIEDIEELRRRNEARRRTKSAYVSRRLKQNVESRSNGESALRYFTDKIKDNALYLLDEPENSLSAKLQMEIAKFIEESARFYGCQFVISTHSPFILSLKGARIYNLDSTPVAVSKWYELENIKLYFELFQKNSKDFLQK